MKKIIYILLFSITIYSCSEPSYKDKVSGFIKNSAVSKESITVNEIQTDTIFVEDLLSDINLEKDNEYIKVDELAKRADSLNKKEYLSRLKKKLKEIDNERFKLKSGIDSSDVVFIANKVKISTNEGLKQVAVILLKDESLFGISEMKYAEEEMKKGENYFLENYTSNPH